MTDYREINRANWDERAPAHAASPDYGVERFAADPAYLSQVVRFDLPRLGARMTGLDFSPPAIDAARRLATAAGADANFVEAEVYDAPAVLGRERFDLIFTGVGALCWLPDVRRWAGVVAALLRPGGRLFIREGHPMLWACGDPRPDGLLVLEHPYFEQTEPLVWDEPGTYVATDHVFTSNVTHEWNHGIGEIVTALLAAGLELTMLEEHDTVPWEAFPGQMEDAGGGEWRLRDRPERLAHTYTLQARKPA
jgi:SAM-dependent methyltransferase